MKVFDLFCGTGGFSHGIKSLAPDMFDVILGIDALDIAISTFTLNHNRAIGITGDIRQIRRKDIQVSTGVAPGQLDILIGGPPCQGFSSIRPFRSSKDDDPRNSLFEEYASFVNYFRPKCFVLENVVGVATHKKGQTVESMQNCFHAIGYDTEWRILNSAHYGVPQKRERFIMVGVERGGDIIFPTPTHTYRGRTIGSKDQSKTKLYYKNEFNTTDIIPSAITTMEAIGDLPIIMAGENAIKYTTSTMTEYQAARRKNNQILSMHTATNHSNRMMEIIKHSGSNIDALPAYLNVSGFSSCYSRLDPNEPAVTLTVNFVNPASNKCIHPILDRALTPREGARLQSFDDDFIFAGSKTQITRQIGNAVPPLLGRAIANMFVDIL